MYIGFFTYAGYDRLIIESSEEACWKAMKKEYYLWKTGWNGHLTWSEAKDYFGYTVQKATTGDIIEY